jgi:hypothetical protein
VTARLEHKRPAQVVVKLARLPPLLEDRGAPQLGIAAGHDPDRLARGMHVDDVKFHAASGGEGK